MAADGNTEEHDDNDIISSLKVKEDEPLLPRKSTSSSLKDIDEKETNDSDVELNNIARNAENQEEVEEEEEKEPFKGKEKERKKEKYETSKQAISLTIQYDDDNDDDDDQKTHDILIQFDFDRQILKNKFIWCWYCISCCLPLLCCCCFLPEREKKIRSKKAKMTEWHLEYECEGESKQIEFESITDLQISQNKTCLDRCFNINSLKITSSKYIEPFIYKNEILLYCLINIDNTKQIILKKINIEKNKEKIKNKKINSKQNTKIIHNIQFHHKTEIEKERSSVFFGLAVLITFIVFIGVLMYYYLYQYWQQRDFTKK